MLEPGGWASIRPVLAATGRRHTVPDRHSMADNPVEYGPCSRLLLRRWRRDSAQQRILPGLGRRQAPQAQAPPGVPQWPAPTPVPRIALRRNCWRRSAALGRKPLVRCTRTWARGMAVQLHMDA